ncbi:MAG TPA: tetratricopeptide repeat protein [Pyrinomonadaceae bacterium]|nr:tetratricopeptide repeat protein [Pyrinomonadaceae bacterium]
MLTRNIIKTSLSLFVVLFLVSTVRAQQSQLGRVEFPTSASGQAQAHFLRGVAALHSFWYEEALEEFRAATRIDPGFAMGYWGEAMAHNHPLWAQQDTEAGRKTLARLDSKAKVTPREQAFLKAVKALYGEGDKEQRDLAYAKEMEQVYLAYPDDLEAASFYALSLLGLIRPGDKGFTRQMKAGAIALDVYQKNPYHPGAAHYVIHAFDDPEHAILALPAARRYAEIAPEAYHARHMPSHIFIQLGMWPEAAASNESSWAASVSWVKRKNLSPNLRDFHSLQWLNYIYLQQGRYEKAEALLAVMLEAMAEPGARPARLLWFYPLMAAENIVETEKWDAVERYFEAPEFKQLLAATPGRSQEKHTIHPGARGDEGSWIRYNTEAYASFIHGLVAAKRLLGPETEKHLYKLRSLRQLYADAGRSYQARWIEIFELGLAAELDSRQGKHTEAMVLMERATALEQEMSPPSGPPDLVKPSHELFGEILMRADRPKEASAQFATALVRQPRRARSLLGAARAAAALGDRKNAAAHYAAFLSVQDQADERSAEAREAHDYLAQVAVR